MVVVVDGWCDSLSIMINLTILADLLCLRVSMDNVCLSFWNPIDLLIESFCQMSVSQIQNESAALDLAVLPPCSCGILHAHPITTTPWIDPCCCLRDERWSSTG